MTVASGHGTSAVSALLEEGTRRLTHAGLGTARQEVAWLLRGLLKVSLPEVYLYDAPIPLSVVERFRAALAQRAGGTPLQYVLGEAEFYGNPFAVSAGVFIPRPETESLVEAFLEAFRQRGAAPHGLRFLDLGTGTGCIAITLAQQLPTCVVVGLEVSCHALRIAQTNVRRYGLQDRVRLVRGSWTAALRGAFDGIISNPPYIPSGDVDCLPSEVRCEPRLSLDGGRGGLRDLARVLEEAPRLLAPDGLLVMECGEEHVPVLVQRLRQSTWVRRATPLDDLAGRARGVLAIHR